jgi:PTS system nitrogen regulatory IIA component
MELPDILAEGSVLFCTGVKSKDQLLRLLSEHAAKVTGQDAGTVFEALLDREALGSTGLGNGIAVPHGKFPGLKQVTAVFARLQEPVEFDAVDDMPVDLVMMLMAPVGSGAEHLKALSRVARLLRTERLVDDLRRTTDPKKLYQMLTAPVAAHYAA